MWQKRYPFRTNDISIIKDRPDLRLKVEQSLIVDHDSTFTIQDEFHAIRVFVVHEDNDELIEDMLVRYAETADDLYMLAHEKCVDWYDDYTQRKEEK